MTGGKVYPLARATRQSSASELSENIATVLSVVQSRGQQAEVRRQVVADLRDGCSAQEIAQRHRLPIHDVTDVLELLEGAGYDLRKLAADGPVPAEGWVLCEFQGVTLLEREAYVREGELDALMATINQLAAYRTIDQLEAHEGLVRLAAVLVLLVGLAVLGCVLNGAITVLVSTLMSIRSKTFEIGILRARGFRDGEVLAIFLLQAIVLGMLALAVATAAVYLAEPAFRELVCGAMRIRAASFASSSLFVRSAWPLFAAAAGICLGFSAIGVAIPAAWACRLSPVEALRRRE